jgi:hypothetical protein
MKVKHSQTYRSDKNDFFLALHKKLFEKSLSVVFKFMIMILFQCISTISSLASSSKFYPLLKNDEWVSKKGSTILSIPSYTILNEWMNEKLEHLRKRERESEKNESLLRPAKKMRREKVARIKQRLSDRVSGCCEWDERKYFYELFIDPSFSLAVCCSRHRERERERDDS